MAPRGTHARLVGEAGAPDETSFPGCARIRTFFSLRRSLMLDSSALLRIAGGRCITYAVGVQGRESHIAAHLHRHPPPVQQQRYIATLTLPPSHTVPRCQ